LCLFCCFSFDDSITVHAGVVYSQWTTFLDVVQQAMVEDGIPFTRIDGSMDAPSRLQAMKTFEGTTPTPQGTEPRVMLCSLKAAGTGINLTRANHVYMMDCWWNVAQENQAMDRIHRIGQERPVEAIRFVMADSIEERVLQVQEAKETLGKGILKRLKKTERGKAKVTALRDLFEMDQHQFIEWDGVYEDEDDDLRRIVMGDE
jgi:SNF2 family DNA or RNA helicase